MLSTINKIQPHSISLAFIDANVSNYQLLATGIVNDVEVIILDSRKNGIEQITKTLNDKAVNQTQVDAIHIFSHGSPGILQLGNTFLNLDSLISEKKQIQTWKTALTKTANILLYGCNVAANIGAEFVHKLSQILELNIAASVNLTGGKLLGGNWNLGFSTGKITAKNPLQPEVMMAYQGVLATIEVTNNNDNGAGSLRQAIATANSGDTILFYPSLANQKITLTSGQLEIDKDLIIDGANATGLTISGNNISRVIDLKSTPDFQPTSLAIKNLIIADGKTKAVDKEGAGAGIRTEQKSSLTVENSKFINNTVSGLGGGAIYSGFQSNATIINSQFENNDASQAIRDSSGELSEHAGGAILMWSESNLTVKGSEFRNNTGINGGAINNLLSNLTIEYSTFINNNSTAGKDSGRGYGGAIYTDGASNNDSLTSGIIRISNSRFQDNEAAGQGGGMFLFAYPPDQIIVENSQILNNQVIYNSTGDALGGGIRAGNAELTITNTSFANNTALSQGGGLWIGENSPTEIINSTFSGNRAESEDGNDGLGGAISLANGSNSNNIINTTIANNYAGFQGGAFWGGGTNTTLKNTIVAYNVANNGGNNWNINHHTGIQFNDGGGNIQSNELNPDDTKITAGVTLADPLLGGLQQINDILVHPLLANSPAIDAGVNTNAPTKDQLGNIRSVDGDENGSAITDIGAYEFSTTSSLPTATDNLPIDNNIIGTPGKDTLTGTNAADTMLGDEGNDTYIINDIRDVIIEDRNAGRDKVKSSVTYSLKDNIENLMLTEAENIHGTGNSLPNYIAGNDNHNKLIGANGHDTLLGVGGEDTLIGSRGNDILIGGTGDDILEGRLGRDRLNGGPGNDTLTGGASIDRFIFNSNRPYQAEDIGRDIITDFRQDQNDLILLDKRTFTAISSVAGEGFSIAEEFEIVSSDAEAIGATGAIIYNQNNGNLFYNSDGMTNGLGEGGLFATLDNSPALESGDFMIR